MFPRLENQKERVAILNGKSSTGYGSCDIDERGYPVTVHVPELLREPPKYIDVPFSAIPPPPSVFPPPLQTYNTPSYLSFDKK
jgi:hypothetical protein